nr:MAG: putative capsid protein 1 [Polycipiviridae sp.]
MDNSEDTKNIISSRAKEIDTGAIPLPMSNVILGLPYKPDPTTSIKQGSVSQSWTYADLISQKKLIADLKVDTKSEGTIWTYQNTWDNVLKTHFSGENGIRLLFGLKSWTISFMFEFRSNFQQLGQFCIFYSNLPKVLETYHFDIKKQESAFKDYGIITQLPHRKIPMGEDQDCIVSLKWLSPHTSSFGNDMYQWNALEPSAEEYTPWYDMGVLRLAVPFPMHVASGVDSTMTVRIWSWLSDFTTGAYHPQDSLL